MMDATQASEIIPNLNAKFSFLPYKFYDDGPAPNKARLFSCMPFVHDGIIHKDVPVPFCAGHMTKEDIEEFLSLFKIKGHIDGAMQAIQLFLQKYSQMKGREGWDSLAEDVEYIGSVDELPLCDLQYKLDVNVQRHTMMGGMSTNGQHRTGKGILVGENWKETTETHFVEDPNELCQYVSNQLQVSLGSILYQPVTVNINYPKSCTWNKDVIADLNAYSAAEDKQGGLQVLCAWKDAVQSVISSLTAEDDLGIWNWDENHCLGNIKMFRLAWRALLRAVYKTIGDGSPARDYILTGLYANQDQLRAAYGNVPGVIDNYVETIFSDVQKIQKTGKKMMEITKIPYHDYPGKMMPLVRHNYREKSKFLSLVNITHYVRVIMFGCYNVETKNVIDDLACGAVAFGVKASPREYLTSRDLFDNALLVVTLLRTALSLATSYCKFMEQTCNGGYKLIHVNREDMAFYRNMLLFIFNRQLLEHARSKGTNPDIEGDPGYFGFHQDDVDRYGYYFLFLRNLPRYAEKMWDLNNADYFHLMPIKEKRMKAKEFSAEAYEESEDEETPPGTPGPVGNDSIQDEWKDVKKYTFDMRDLGKLMRINLKLSVKQLAKKSPKINKCDPSVWDALAWECLEKNLHDIPIHPCVSRIWRALFSGETKTPTAETYACSE
jgi:hypothetical protein